MPEVENLQRAPAAAPPRDGGKSRGKISSVVGSPGRGKPGEHGAATGREQQPPARSSARAPASSLAFARNCELPSRDRGDRKILSVREKPWRAQSGAPCRKVDPGRGGSGCFSVFSLTIASDGRHPAMSSYECLVARRSHEDRKSCACNVLRHSWAQNLARVRPHGVL